MTNQLFRDCIIAYSPVRGGKLVVADRRNADRRKHIVFAFENKAESDPKLASSAGNFLGKIY